jgi:hypothetical protein
MSKDTTSKDYTQYTVEDFLQDDFFIQSIQNPTEESIYFWNNLIQENQLNVETYELAQFCIESFQVKKKYMSSEEIADLWENIEITNKSKLKKRFAIHRLYISIAACILLCICFSFLLWNRPFQQKYYNSNIENVKKPDIQGEEALLVLSDAQIIAMEENETNISYDPAGIKIKKPSLKNQEEIVIPEKAMSYNQLIVPMGKRSTLALQDGTKIWVNAGTRIVYPAVFDAKKREIYVDGEIFLEVAPDNQWPFVVKTNKLDVEVLGTSFNVMAYEGDNEENIVLVSGAVRIHTKDNKQTSLNPNNMYSLSGNGYGYIKTVDVNDYISWKNGLYRFQSEDMSIILKRLSRYYGKKITCDHGTAGMKCSGKLDLKDDLLTVLEGLTLTAPVVCNAKDEGYELRVKN